MVIVREACGWRRACQPARYVVFFGLMYGYVLWVLDPRLLFHDQSPAFFMDRAFGGKCVRSWPGGLVEYLSAGLSQFYLRPRLGALLVTAAVGLVCVLTGLVLGRAAMARALRLARTATGDASVLSNTCRLARLLPFLPALCLLVLLSRYALPLSVMVSLCAALLMVDLVSRFRWHRTSVRVLAIVGVGVGLYVTAGPVSVMFACLCGLWEMLVRRSLLAGAVILVAGGLVPYVLGAQVYQIGTLDAYWRLDSFNYDYYPPLASIALYGSFPLIFIIASGWPGGMRRSNRLPPKKAHGAEAESSCLYREGPLGWVVRTILLVGGGAAVAYASFDADRRAALAVDYHARARRWEQALIAARPLAWSGFVPGRKMEERLSRPCPLFRFPAEAQTATPILPSYDAVIHNVNFALAQTGRLLDEMFSYPQLMGVSVVRLLPDSMGAYVAHAYNIDVLLELGDVNDAERLAGECLANVGPRLWLLERLVVISVLKDRPETARVCLTVMSRDPLGREWAEACRRELDADATLSGRPEIQRVRSRMYRRDHAGLMHINPDDEMLRYLLAENPHNRMAFDYLTAHYLLDLQHDQVVRNVQFLKEFGYTRLPRHCEEALLLYKKFGGAIPNLRNLRIRPETIRRFDAFQRDMDALGGPGGPDNLKVRDALVAEYADTYWFYVLFGNTFFGHDQAVASSQPGGNS